MNTEHYENVLNVILANPMSWNQREWHNACNTAHCFAGHAQILLLGKEYNVDEHGCSGEVQADARVYLDIGTHIAAWLFAPYRTLKDFVVFLAIVKADPSTIEKLYLHTTDSAQRIIASLIEDNL